LSSRPTITAVLPDSAKATGTAVLVIPGGGFFALAIDEQGLDVARWLADRGAAAFVLKYRVEPTSAERKALQQRMTILTQAVKANPDGILRGERTADEDARAAFTLLIHRAAEFGVDPTRLGVLGFSSGGFMAIDLATGPKPRPAFVGDLYAPVRRWVHVPDGAPPMFTAMAADDALFGKNPAQSFEMWRDAHAAVELHIYETGGHGFGMSPQGTTSDEWIVDFYRWLGTRGWVQRE
jgi:acetyl esterase/lipase